MSSNRGAFAKMKGFGNDADEVFGVNVNTMTC